MGLAKTAIISFACPFMGKMFLIVVDSHSKWFEVEIMLRITNEATIAKLLDMCVQYGIPQHLIRDNSTLFTSEEFCRFMKANCIKHTLVAHPQSNDQAEHFVQTFKQFLR